MDGKAEWREEEDGKDRLVHLVKQFEGKRLSEIRSCVGAATNSYSA